MKRQTPLEGNSGPLRMICLIIDLNQPLKFSTSLNFLYMECKVTALFTLGFSSLWANTRPRKLQSLINYSTGKCDLVQMCNF